MGLIGHTVLFFVSLSVFIGTSLYVVGVLGSSELVAWYHRLLFVFSFLGIVKSMYFLFPNRKETIVK